MTCIAVNTARSKLLESGLAWPDSLKGCRDEELNSLERWFSVRLPQCYRDFLAVVGRAAGEFLVGTDYAFPKILEFHKDAESLLRASQSDYQLPFSAFVFIVHQGYTFSFFDCQNDPDDPPVFLFSEGDLKPRKVSDSFSAWLLTAVEADVAVYRELNGD